MTCYLTEEENAKDHWQKQDLGRRISMEDSAFFATADFYRPYITVYKTSLQ